MKKLITILAIFFTGLTSIQAQVGINATGAAPASSAMLDISSTTKGLLIPRMTTTQRTTGIASPATGLLVYDTNLNNIYIFDGSIWKIAGGGAGTLTLPFEAFQSNGNFLINVYNSVGGGVHGVSEGSGLGVLGESFAGGRGVTGVGFGLTSFGVFGISPNIGVYGEAPTGKAIQGAATSTGIGGLFSSTLGLALKTTTGNVEHDGFTKLGNDATPRIKMKKLTGTTPTSANPNTFTFLAHGITGSKILSISVLVDVSGFQYLPHSSETGSLYSVNVDPNQLGGAIAIGVKDVTASGNIMNKPFKVLITYEE